MDSFLVALRMNCHFPKMTIVSTVNFTTSLMLFWGVGLETINENHWSWKEIIKMVWNLLCCSVEVILIVKYMFFRFADWLGRSIYFWRCKILYKVSLFNYEFFPLVIQMLWLTFGCMLGYNHDFLRYIIYYWFYASWVLEFEVKDNTQFSYVICLGIHWFSS